MASMWILFALLSLLVPASANAGPYPPGYVSVADRPATVQVYVVHRGAQVYVLRAGSYRYHTIYYYRHSPRGYIRLRR